MNHRLTLTTCGLLAVSLMAGCGEQAERSAPAAPSTPKPTVSYPEGPSGVRIDDVHVTWRTPAVIQLEIPYKFTSGGPRKVYAVHVAFPGTTASGVRPLEASELSLEGVIKTGIEVGDAAITAYTVDFQEAEAPDREFISITTPVKGEVTAERPRE
ncbi:hypothetical protein Pan44_27730 [Caulifigura coniformis]|uniref:Lipoprotein n=1 Tax=Caulifigura coniformis TaxID=2527983 RepID=A0A517SF61_9PLAN|nr:hypothetical protein [Caulifigura coniformis]QDT54737.1 hypothetical protein Pan44_27730 [Caulifigura coniformis]